MAREMGQIKADWNAVNTENSKRIAAQQVCFEQLDAQFGTHDRAELEKILAERKDALDAANAAYQKALEDVDAYVLAAKEALGL